MLKQCPACEREFDSPNNRQITCSMPCRAALRKQTWEDRFWGNVTKTSECWEWNGYLVGYGYGRMGTGRNSYVLVHRYSYEKYYGPIPDGLLVCHKCDNPKCLRPDHLFLGTHGDNVRDKCSKNRQRTKPLPGESNGNARLSEVDVIAIRQLANQCTYAEIGRRYGVAAMTIRCIVLRKNWKHVE